MLLEGEFHYGILTSSVLSLVALFFFRRGVKDSNTAVWPLFSAENGKEWRGSLLVFFFLLPRPFGRLFVECSFAFCAFVIVVVVVVGSGGGVPFLFRPSFLLPRIFERK